jgi:hypothetical protein
MHARADRRSRGRGDALTSCFVALVSKDPGHPREEYRGTSGLPPSARHRGSDYDGQEMLLNHQVTPAELFAFRVVDGRAVDLPGSNQAAIGL